MISKAAERSKGQRTEPSPWSDVTKGEHVMEIKCRGPHSVIIVLIKWKKASNN